MKIKKFPQSCLLVNAGKIKILIDPGTLKYDEKFLKDWQTADVILVTHKHPDHINAAVVAKLGKPVYSSAEVQSAYPDLKVRIIKQGDELNIEGIKIKVVKAIHGFIPKMKGTGAGVFENLGYILNDGEVSLYITSDTVCFNNDYIADYIFAPLTGHCVTMDAFGCALYTKMIGAKKLIVAHLDNDAFAIDISAARKELDNHEINYILPEIEQEIVLK